MEQVPSMAAALAASLPAPSAAPAVAAPVLEFTIPASMSRVIDVEAEIPVKEIQLDGMVCTDLVFICFLTKMLQRL